jgi:predicted site-specific integrase-resolvase
MSNKNFVGGKEASKIIGVHQRTLYLWEKKKLIETIRTPGGKRLYNIEKYIKEQECENENKLNNYICEDLDSLDKISGKLNICYVRVSSNGQKDDLERQKEQMIKNFPNYKIIEDIGSGLNLNKRGIKKIITLAIDGKINEVVIAYRDRLTRFGFELIEELIKKYSNGKIKVLNEKEQIEPEEELIKDMMSIMNVYVAKMNGLRKYNKIKKTEDNIIKPFTNKKNI